jgi:hypothetical protein
MFHAQGSLILAAVCWSVLHGSPVEPGGHDSSAKQHIQIRIFNLALVSRRDLSQAKREVNRIFAEAGIDVSWADGSPQDNVSLITDFSASNSTATSCEVARNARELLLQLLPNAPNGVDPRTLGYSLPCAGFGIDSTIFINKCEGVAFQTPVSFGKVLAYAMAHELGHVLLRSTEHAGTGLMRPQWDRTTWIRAATRGISIDLEQARRMRIALAKMDSAAH